MYANHPLNRVTLYIAFTSTKSAEKMFYLREFLNSNAIADTIHEIAVVL